MQPSWPRSRAETYGWRAFWRAVQRTGHPSSRRPSLATRSPLSAAEAALLVEAPLPPRPSTARRRTNAQRS
eukprot:3080705-Heterocapsa_arctica.AAC.1